MLFVPEQSQYGLGFSGVNARSDSSEPPDEHVLEERRQERMRQLERITRGGNNSKVHVTMTVDLELVYEEFVDALVKAAALKYPSKSKGEALEHLISTHLTGTVMC